VERLSVELARKVKGGGNDALVVGCDCVYRRQRRLLLRRGPDGDRLVTKGVSGAAREVGVRVGERESANNSKDRKAKRRERRCWGKWLRVTI
jgi:hypothetical protein